MLSSRLTYEQLEPSHLDEFHSFMRDEQVRRYLLGGNVFPVEWSAEQIQDSQALFKRRGVGFWLVRQQTSGELLGFCGFMEIPSVHPEPQIIYALFKRFSGKVTPLRWLDSVSLRPEHRVSGTSSRASTQRTSLLSASLRSSGLEEHPPWREASAKRSYSS